MKLTKTKIETLPIPEKGEKLYWDSELSGFGVRVTAKGVRSYIVQGRVNGKERRITIGQHGKPISETEILNADKARKLAMGQIASISKGVDPVIERKRAETIALTLRDVATDYCKNRQTTKGGALTDKTVRDIERHIKTNFGDWADKPIVNITSEMCRDRFTKISDRSPSQGNQAFRILRALINFSIDEENPRFNPVTTLSKKKLWKQNKSKSGFIPVGRKNEKGEVEEECKVGYVWNMLQERRTSPCLLPIAQTGADIIIFLILTGCRWSEAAELTWSCVNLEAGSWHDPDPKNHNPVTFPLSAPARAMLETRPRIEGNDYVFTGRGKTEFIKDARNTMDEVSKLAGLHLSPHDMRRTFNAIGIELDIEMWKLKLLTNHISKGDVHIDNYTETIDLRYLSKETEAVAAWIVEQGKIAAGKNVIQLREVAA
jgi:integrase